MVRHEAVTRDACLLDSDLLNEGIELDEAVGLGGGLDFRSIEPLELRPELAEIIEGKLLGIRLLGLREDRRGRDPTWPNRRLVDQNEMKLP